MALIGTVPTLRAQLARPDHFAAAFRYLEHVFDPASEERARILATPVGESRRIDLAGGGAFALEQVFRSKSRAEGRFEAHRSYVDLQAVVQGDEVIEVADVSNLTVREDLLDERDACFFHDFPGASLWRMHPGKVSVFFPVDAHMPCLAFGEPGIVYKTVVKVPVPAA